MFDLSHLLQPKFAERRGIRFLGPALALSVLYPYSWADYAAHRGLFGNLRSFVTFIGYPRSGHSLVGALLNAHPQALIAHELFVTRYLAMGFSKPQILALLRMQDRMFAAKGWVHTGYDYSVPGGFQGVHDDLRVIGDKKGGATTWHLTRRPDLLPRLRRTIGLPLRLVHNIRNPYDNIATMAKWDGRGTAHAITEYRRLSSTIATTIPALEDGELLEQWHEDLVADAEGQMARLCAFVGLDAGADYLAACRSVVFPSAKRSRDGVRWTGPQVDEIEAMCREFPFLARYAGSGATLTDEGAA